ncbi:bifunctional protein-serine/threonine kinase/phosphatase [Photobacterium japonica]|uniref:protein kinase domain-containing protein n=1 Tax=Photobacterium japonica TaxID=2910235 RepID=UPI003D10A86E
MIIEEVLANNRYGLVVSAGGHSCAGKRAINQDAFAVKIPQQAREYTQKGVVACVADGVSGSQYAQQASQITVTQFIEDYYAAPATWGVRPTVSKILHGLNQWFYHQGQQRDFAYEGSVTTFCAAVIKSNTAHIMHAGDSRVYLFRRGRAQGKRQLRCLTQDHRRRQYGGQYMLTRGLGMDSHLEVDYQQLPLEVGDQLIFTTDGVHDAFANEAQFTAVLNAAQLNTVAVNNRAEKQAQYVVNAALKGEVDGVYTHEYAVKTAKKKSPPTVQDNATCVIVNVEALPEWGTDEMLNALLQRVIPPVLNVGQRLDHYTITEVVHSGSRSHVYQAVSDKDGQRYALKVPSLHFAEDYVYLQGFIREGWVGAQIRHPQILRIYSDSCASAFLYHVCQWVEGITLRQWMAAHPNPPLAAVQRLAQGMIKAARALQRQGIVHRDLKPENIMITADETVMIIDLGTVQADSFNDDTGALLSESVPVGDKKYLAPECGIGQKATVQSDLFSIAVMWYEMLSGHYPYGGTAEKAAFKRPKDSREYSPIRHYRHDLPMWVDVVLCKACHPQAECRYVALSECIADFTHPSTAVLEKAKRQPLPLTASLTFWKLLSLGLFVIVLIQCFLP